ncbi:uncharacterized protein LOC117179128 [Belonocnema kinseyi]|uniref:uncharacterized protein LOC117179128 n=1 Tax=Belonocnema kinseyi TaxID=2817044 RepID=UPI00143DD71D|nr:uncharacterized protein LOC117179128 [Belonocnema kinseyi]
MIQGGRRTTKINGSKIGKSYSSSLESSRSYDDSISEITTLSHSSGDQKIRHNNYRNSKNFNTRKSHFVLRKDTDSNDSGFRKNSHYSNKHNRRHHHHHEDNILTSKNFRTEKPNCHKFVDSKSNKRGSKSARKDKSRLLENESCRRFSSIEVNALSDRTSLCNNFHSQKNEKHYFKSGFKCNHINDKLNRRKEKEKDGIPDFGNLDYNEGKNVSIFSQDEKDRIEDSIEGSARTRVFYLKKEDVKNCKKLNQDLNIDLHYFRNSTKITKYQPKKRSTSESEIENKIQLRKVKSVEKSSKNSFDSNVDKTKKTRKIDNKETKIADAKEEVLTSISNLTIKSLFQSKKSQGHSRKCSKGPQKKCKIKGKNNSNINLNSENDISEEGKVENLITDSEVKIADKKLREFQEIKKSIKKNQKRKRTRYKNSRPEFKRKTLRYLNYLIRRVILSDREDNKNEDRDKKMLKNKIESGCECSEYASLKNIEDRLSEINENENSETSFSNYLESAYLKNSPSEIDKERIKDPVKLADECSSALTCGEPLLNQRQACARTPGMRVAFRPILCQADGSPHVGAELHASDDFTETPMRKIEIEFLDTEKYCIYKIYKSTDGVILIKESQRKELREGEYVIGRRILKDPETLLPFSINTSSEKNVNQLFSHRNNSTQTEIDLTKQSSKNKSWFRKLYTQKYQRRSKKYFTSLESRSNSSFLESSDFQQIQSTFTKS